MIFHTYQAEFVKGPLQYLFILICNRPYIFKQKDCHTKSGFGLEYGVPHLFHMLLLLLLQAQVFGVKSLFQSLGLWPSLSCKRKKH
jgi:hypothetical protein